MRQLEILYATFIVILCLLVEYWVVKSNDSILFSFSIIILCMILKIGYIITQSFKSIIGIVKKGTAYHQYLLYVSFIAIIITASYGSDFFALQLLAPDSFDGMEGITNEFEVFFKMFYLSLLLFTNLGVADISPASTYSEILVMSEGIIAFVSLIFMLSDFTSLRESFSKKDENLIIEDGSNI